GTPLLVRSSSDSALAPPQMEDLNSRTMGTRIQTDPSFAGEVSGCKDANFFNLSSLTKTVEISGERGPLGIHVVPYCSSLSGRFALGDARRPLHETAALVEDIVHTQLINL
ncbi:putative partitioning defective 3-like protein B, partial [Triplophysa rosa]